MTWTYRNIQLKQIGKLRSKRQDFLSKTTEVPPKPEIKSLYSVVE